ncbi:MAG: ParB N-terminal domain-containing protein, partial [Eubacterium sp.]|nr:ParB N-terminal domain-containing protein [Eubacterium sp.]
MNGIDFLRQKAQDNIFSTQEQRDTEKIGKLVEVNLSDLHDFKNHPFKVVEDADMIDLRKSIEENGVLEPAIAFWNEDNELELATGHRRKYACSTLGYETMPILIKNLSRDEATILMGESNIQRRQDILPSEKGFAYKMMLDAMKRQGKRNDLNSSEKKGKSSEELAEKVNESSKQIYRFIKITVLIKPLLDLVDAKRIALRPAVEIAELPKKLQNV